MTHDLLVVHPDPNERKRIRELAGRHGFRVCESDSGVGGMILAREAAPDLVVVGLDHGEPADFVALRLIRSQLGDRARLLAVGLADPAMRQLAQDLGADLALDDLTDGEVLRRAVPIPEPGSVGDTVASLP